MCHNFGFGLSVQIYHSTAISCEIKKFDSISFFTFQHEKCLAIRGLDTDSELFHHKQWMKNEYQTITWNETIPVAGFNLSENYSILPG